ncbi:MAG: hypothetical protein JSS32_00820 [Verrucomicrobia bacterium]|nr:hypothetical protein [Verrucomicrobiota bacterium]
MNLQTKALYNLIRLNAQEDTSVDVEPWAVEDLREIPIESLFQKLTRFGILLEKHTFASFAEACDTPEDLTEIFLEEALNPKESDQVYLIIFELWRRLLPEKQSLSIFCDELDNRIFLYDKGQLESDEPIQDALANLKEILDENVDNGAEPAEIFQAICNFCAHDVEGFLYDYITDLLDTGNTIYASELIEGYCPFTTEPIWFEFLKARMISFTDPAKANAEMARILDQNPINDTAFLFEMLSFLAVSGEHPLFIAVIQKILSQIQSEDEFQELMEITADYYRRLDKDEIEAAIERLMKKRDKKTTALDPKDPDLRIFAEALK